MPRKGAAPRRPALPDPRYRQASPEARRRITKLINSIMRDGRRHAAERVVYDALDMVQARSEEDAVAVFERALTNVRPRLEVKSRRVGGATYQVPVDVRPERSVALGMRWIILAARERGEKGMVHRLANEVIDAAANRGNAVKKRDDTHKMAEANKAFAHYRW